MVFSSIVFLFAFLPIVLTVYYVLKPQLRNIFLLIASLFFYYWGEPKFLIVMVASILWNYLCGIVLNIFIDKNRSQRFIERFTLFVGVAVNVGLLFYFKYFNFSIELLNSIFHCGLAVQNIVLPIGISFFTFQGISYIIDVYRRDVPAQKNPLKFGMYISLFPQLIAGPIVRYADIEKEINCRSVTLNDFYQGMVRFVVGLSKKVIIANTLANQVDKIFAQDVTTITQGTAWLGAIMYALQIYFDFSGYSDMAIGLGRIFGFTFLENFNLPYIATSVKEFWRRWHISLSTWFRDYVYIPLGGNRRGNVYFNLLVVFFLTGLWHGASLNFIVWGLWHGLFLIVERILLKREFRFMRDSAPAWVLLLRRIYTLLVVLIGWVFFRADTLSIAWNYLGVMFGFVKNEMINFSTMYYLNHFTIVVLVVGILFSTNLPAILLNKIKKVRVIRSVLPYLESLCVVLLLLICAILVMASTYNPFIYFRF